MFYLGFERFFAEVYKALRPPQKMSLSVRRTAPHTQNHHCVPNQNLRQKKGDPFKTKTSSKFTKYCACHKNDLRIHLAYRPTPAKVFPACRKCHTCHTDANVSDVLHLSRKPSFQASKSSGSPTLATKNGHCSKKQAPRAGKSRPSEETKPLHTFCASHRCLN